MTLFPHIPLLPFLLNTQMCSSKRGVYALENYFGPPKRKGLEDDFPFHLGDFLKVPAVNFQVCKFLLCAMSFVDAELEQETLMNTGLSIQWEVLARFCSLVSVMSVNTPSYWYWLYNCV